MTLNSQGKYYNNDDDETDDGTDDGTNGRTENDDEGRTEDDVKGRTEDDVGGRAGRTDRGGRRPDGKRDGWNGLDVYTTYLLVIFLMINPHFIQWICYLNFALWRCLLEESCPNAPSPSSFFSDDFPYMNHFHIVKR